MFTGLVKSLMKFCSNYSFTKQKSKSRISIKMHPITLNNFDFRFVKN